MFRGVNLGYETPLVRSNPMGPPPNWALFDESLVPGWNTTASDNLIELWESTFLGVTSYAGGQHAEMNATQPSTMNQDFATLGGDEVDWTVAHRGRTAPTDSADLRFGAPGTPTLVQVMVSPITNWVVYSGTYVVPAGQSTTQISFVSNDPGSLGNFLDGIELSLVCDIAVTTTFAGFTDVDLSSHTNPGDTAAFTYLVENLGTATVETLQVSDSLGFVASCPVTTLMPGESTTCTGSYVLTAAEVDSGEVTSVATATAQDAEDVEVSDTDTVTEPIPSQPLITIDKSATLDDSVVAPSGRVDAGDEINYTFTVANTGNVTLDSVVVTDDAADSVTCPGSTLASGETMICTGTLVLSQAQIDSGSVANIANAEGSFGNTVVSAADTATVLLAPSPGIGVSKVGTVDSGVVAPVDRVDPGDTANYDITVVNTGNVTLDPVAVSDPIAAPVSCGTSTLAPGETVVCTAAVTLDQATIDAGTLSNTAVATGNPPGADPGDTSDDVTASSTETLEFSEQSLVGLAKSLEELVINSDGTIEITFRYTVENFGNVTAEDLSVTDDVITLFAGLSPEAFATSDGTLAGSEEWNGTATSNLLAPGQSLAPGESGNVLARFTIRAALEVEVDNLATVTATSAGGSGVSDTSTAGTDPDPDGDGDPTNNSEPTTVMVPRLYDLEITKTAVSPDPESSNIDWIITVTNNGPGDAPGPISVVDTASPGLELDSATGTGWSCDLLETEATCTRAEGLTAGATTSILISSTAPASNRSIVTNSAALELVDSDDLDPTNNVAAVSVAIGDLPFTGFGASQLVVLATMLCTMGLVLVWRGGRRVIGMERQPRHRA